jgi:FkbM family methyltransferase
MEDVKQIGLQVPHAIFFNPPIFSNFIGHQMAEVYKDAIYEPYLRGKSNLNILDIGANVGVTAYYFSHFGHVFAVEPSAEHFAILDTMIKFNRLEDKITPINKAIYIRSGKFDFYHPNNKTCYSLHAGVTPNPAGIEVGKEMVEAIPLDTLFEENKIEHIDLLKLDVEGSEFEILASEGFGKVAPKIDLIMGEIHQWANRNKQQLIDALENNNFKLEKITGEADLFVAKRNV